MPAPTPSPSPPSPLDAIDRRRPHPRPHPPSTRPPSPSSAPRSSPTASACRSRSSSSPSPDGPHRYGLISGFRRLAAYRALAADGLDRPSPPSPPSSATPTRSPRPCHAMVEENAIRAEVSPWNRLLRRRDRPRPPHLRDRRSRNRRASTRASPARRRSRLRSIAHLAEELDGCLTAPETLSLRQLLRLAAASVPAATPTCCGMPSSELSNREPEAPVAHAAAPDPRRMRGPRDPRPPPRPRPPRPPAPHLRRPARRHHASAASAPADGWCLHFTGKDAQSGLIDDVIDRIEALFRPA